MKGYEEEELTTSLRNIINLDLDLEKTKQNLSLRADFNLFVAFRILDQFNNGYLYKTDLETSLSKLRVYPRRNELNLFFKKYDLDSDGKIKFSEFCDAFTPKDKTYSDHLNNKRVDYSSAYPEDAFTFTTKLEYADAFKKHF